MDYRLEKMMNKTRLTCRDILLLDELGIKYACFCDSYINIYIDGEEYMKKF